MKRSRRLHISLLSIMVVIAVCAAIFAKWRPINEGRAFEIARMEIMRRNPDTRLENYEFGVWEPADDAWIVVAEPPMIGMNRYIVSIMLNGECHEFQVQIVDLL